MPESDKEKTPPPPTKADKLNAFLQKNIAKGELALKHAVGLGQTPNVVPEGTPIVNAPARPVLVGWHPVAGTAGKWFADETGLGRMITERIKAYPDPTQHWAVLVGEYAHQLWMDENFDVIYTNEKIKIEEWKVFSVGETHFNDDALRRTGESVIKAMRDEQPRYNLINNNCQTYALRLLDAIKVDGRKQFGTTLAVYEKLVGPGSVKDLFPDVEMPLHEPQPAQPGGRPTLLARPSGKDSVSVAQQVMDDNTTQLDTEEQSKRSVDDGEGKGKKKRFGGFRIPGFGSKK